MSFHRPYFINPLLGGADPCICRGKDGKFYFVVILEDGLGIYCSESLSDPGKLVKVLELAAGVCRRTEDIFEMTFCAKGDKLTVSVNGEELISACDSTCPHGRMGFYCEADTNIYSAEIRLC